MIKILEENFEATGPYWDTKDYVYYRRPGENVIWLKLETQKTVLRLYFYVRQGSFDESQLKSTLHPGVTIVPSRKFGERIGFTIDNKFDIYNSKFISFIREIYQKSRIK